jgi:hypothetical protein
MCICTWLPLVEPVAGKPVPANFPVQAAVVTLLSEQKRLQGCGMTN